MKTIVTTVVAVSVLMVGAAAANAWSGGGAAGASVTNSSDATKGVPEPSTLYAIGSAVVLLGGAGWYIRRRK